MLFQVTEIDFDFTDSEGTITEDEQKRFVDATVGQIWEADDCLLYTSPSPRD